MDETTSMSGSREPRRVLSGRYVLQGLLGQGGMADVELAYDQLLDRHVAIKILHHRYANDPQFIGRFRREAQAAASLNHPNIVAVYDTGEQDGRPFIVMEYVAGRSLKEVLASDAMPPDRAAEIAAETAAALHYAHERGLVHRDVKPGNIMVSEDGVAKVTDFGIARAVGAESVTQTAAIFGTAAYVSPEQAQGQEVDRRSDVYSLGCCLYEMLTHRQPFAADSAVALAYKHVSEDPIPPTRLNPEISATLEAVTMKAMAKEPAARYQSAQELSVDLQRARRGMAVSAPPVVLFERTQALTPAPTAVLPAAGYEPVYQEEWYEQAPARSPWMNALIALLVLVALVGGVLALSNIFGGAEELVTVPPEVVNMHIGDAQQLLREAGFDPVLGPQRSDPKFGLNRVITTDPAPGTTAARGSVVTITYSQGPPVATVPEVEGLEEAEARRLLIEAGFRIGQRATQPSDEVPEGRVIGTNPPAGDEEEQGTLVALVISEGPSTFTLPNTVGMTEAEARRALENACDDEPPCVRIVVEREASTRPTGEVLRQTPGGGAAVEPGATVRLVVSQLIVETTPSPTSEPSPTEPEPTETPTTPTPTPTGTETLAF